MWGGFEIGKKAVAVILVVVLADQLTKALIMARMDPYEVVEVIPGFFNIVRFLNPGAAFGIFSQGGAPATLFLAAVTVVSLGIIGYLLLRSTSVFEMTALALIAGGASGNLIDRVRFRGVVDFLDFHLNAYHWPAFNVADSAITVGVFIFLCHHYFFKKDEHA